MTINLTVGYKDAEMRLDAMEELAAAAIKAKSPLAIRIVETTRRPPLLFPAEMKNLIYGSDGRLLGV